MVSNFKREMRKDFAFWYMFINAVVITLLVIFNYDHPEFGFRGEGYGLGVVILFLFPTIWILIFAFCKYIEQKNLKIAELQKINVIKKEEETLC